MTTIFPRNTRHSLAYYEGVLRILLNGITSRQRQAAIADALNQSGIPASTGAPWTPESVKSVLKRLRARSGPHWNAILELCFDGKMTPAQCKPLLQTM
ncbi:recombinase family protein [Azohydromonas aeria]|uniref:recombinase family protein n=1 Tax=Azohydromonas aeria TaxID=2590212 RepID=UPI0012FB7B77|nr:recombinase family protein [Azohydromonas aeria]